MNYIQITRIGNKSIGYLLHDGAVVLFEQRDAENALTVGKSLFPEMSGFLGNRRELQDRVLDFTNARDCCYFVPVDVVRYAGGFEEDAEFVAAGS